MNVFIDPAFYNYYQQYPIRLVDIGASGGLQSNWKGTERYLQVIAFEPDERAFADLVKGQTSKAKYLNTALYKKKTSLNFHIARKQGGSSLLLLNRTLLDKFPEVERFDILETIKIKVDTLDNQLRQHQIEDVDFIKLDTQGSELFILEGATRTLSDVFGLQIEVEFVELYQVQPLFSDIDRFVREFGFQLFDLRPCYWKRAAGKKYGKPQGQIMFADALYLREAKSFETTLDMFEDDVLKKSKVLRAVSICILYGYLDYALEIFNQSGDVFNDNEIQLFKRYLERNIALQSRIPNFPGRGKIAQIFYTLFSHLKPNFHGWATVKNALGNLG